MMERCLDKRLAIIVEKLHTKNTQMNSWSKKLKRKARSRFLMSFSLKMLLLQWNKASCEGGEPRKTVSIDIHISILSFQIWNMWTISGFHRLHSQDSWRRSGRTSPAPTRSPWLQEQMPCTGLKPGYVYCWNRNGNSLWSLLAVLNYQRTTSQACFWGSYWPSSLSDMLCTHWKTRGFDELTFKISLLILSFGILISALTPDFTQVVITCSALNAIRIFAGTACRWALTQITRLRGRCKLV